ncbi:polymorphic toxin-type HINT domain-containing protein [Lewinella sp. LCG006]|uniref:polymorphic toxin-type HINT domain-containing protein n=1 Tax=Lewinella sp. LCG006 TaxID=3231911 RepID=UPI00345F9C52
MRADSLRQNMKLLALTGALLTVHAVEAFDTTLQVYNFEVEEYHNYFVGEEGVLVHNDCAFVKMGLRNLPQQLPDDPIFDIFTNVFGTTPEATVKRISFLQDYGNLSGQAKIDFENFFRAQDLITANPNISLADLLVARGDRVRAWEVVRDTEFALDVPALTKIAEQIANGVPPSVIKQDAIDVLATGNAALRAQWVETLGNPDFIVLRRGTDFSNEREILDESGYILSDAARVRYNETFYQPGGPNMEDVIQYSDNIHQQWLGIFNGDIDAYAQAHAQAHLNGQSLEEIYGLKRTLISTTSDGTEIDNFYTAGVGNKYIGVFERSRVIEQTLPSSSESEFLVVNGTSLLHKIIE